MEKKITFTFYAPDGDHMTVAYETTDEKQVYTRLASELTAHYIHKAAYIRRIVDRSNYDGTRTTTVYYENARKGVYIVAA